MIKTAVNALGSLSQHPVTQKDTESQLVDVRARLFDQFESEADEYLVSLVSTDLSSADVSVSELEVSFQLLFTLSRVVSFLKVFDPAPVTLTQEHFGSMSSLVGQFVRTLGGEDDRAAKNISMDLVEKALQCMHMQLVARFVSLEKQLAAVSDAPG